MQQEERCINPWVPNLITLVHYLVVMIKRMALTNFQLERRYRAFICQVHELFMSCGLSAMKKSLMEIIF